MTSSCSYSNHVQIWRFLEDSWLEKSPLLLEYPILHNNVSHKNTLVADLSSVSAPNFQFSRAIIGDKLKEWLHVMERLTDISLSEATNYKSDLSIQKKSVKSLYMDLMNGDTRFFRGYLWRLTIHN